MKYEITRQDKYSRGELLLRTIFGAFYIAIPHGFVMFFVGIYAAIIGFIAFWIVLFTGKYPKNWFDYQVSLMSWTARFTASMNNLIDGYPAIGVKGSHDRVKVEIPYPEKINQLSVIIRFLFGAFYVAIPHFFCIGFRMIAHGCIAFVAWWIQLFTGQIPENMFNFMVGTFRWIFRVSAFLGYFTDKYPPFSGKAAA